MKRTHPLRRASRAPALVLALALALGLPNVAPVRAQAPDLTARADRLLGLPYRVDGVLDEKGRWTTFEHPEKTFDSPGLNCSGLEFALMRLLAPSGPPASLAGRDRQGDSGPGASMGQDWDYGFDLTLNLTEGLARRWLLPEPRAVSPADTGRETLGFPLSDEAAWRRALAQVKPGQACLVSFSQTGRRKGYTLQHYHVGVVLPDATGGRWLYQSTPKSGVTKTNLTDPAGMKRFQASFAGKDRRVLLLSADLPPAR
ncbi:hypothetical protein [Fundidesulfovibrio magnetotacticus]|nr:hypothetical protein [Fundidesulfovibrio magnetotacticus]